MFARFELRASYTLASHKQRVSHVLHKSIKQMRIQKRMGIYSLLFKISDRNYLFLNGVHSKRQNRIKDDLKITCC